MSETVLVVDDQEIVRDVIRLALEAAGYTVIAAGSPSHAIELARDDANIDLLVTDVVMPEMDAFELADRITSKLPGLRILFTSGYTRRGRGGPVHPEALHPGPARREGGNRPRHVGPERRGSVEHGRDARSHLYRDRW